jgi:predicted CoA-binding protein
LLADAFVAQKQCFRVKGVNSRAGIYMEKTIDPSYKEICGEKLVKKIQIFSDEISLLEVFATHDPTT